MTQKDPKRKKVAVSITLDIHSLLAIDSEALMKNTSRSAVIQDIFDRALAPKSDATISDLELELLTKTE